MNAPLVFISLQSIKFAWGLHIQIIGPTDQHSEGGCCWWWWW
jgi:hypothetical protein